VNGYDRSIAVEIFAQKATVLLIAPKRWPPVQTAKISSQFS
jgi:hypothetical protein